MSTSPTTLKKLAVLADAAKYDASCASSGAKGRKGKGVGSTVSGICHSYTPDGRCVSLLKILLTNFCVFDCLYCINRSSSNVERARFEVEEVVRLTIDMYRRNLIEGLFLSSGIIKSPDYTMTQMIEVAQLLREREGFGGYIHLKSVAGASSEAVTQAGRFADRISCNIELPTKADLHSLAPEKKVVEIEATMARAKHLIDEDVDKSKSTKSLQRRTRSGDRWAPAGQSTQMIIGASSTPDADILRTSTSLYKRYQMRRVYYSAYSPTPYADQVLPPRSPGLWREHRLYQADWLLRFYGFEVSEIVTPEQPNLRSDIDPKLAWALRNRDRFPVDLMSAEREMLLRIPGFGGTSVEKIICARRHRRLTLADLKRMRVPVSKAKAFLDIPGSNAAELLDRLSLESSLIKPKQLELFATSQSALTGEV